MIRFSLAAFVFSLLLSSGTFAQSPEVDERPALPFPPGISVQSQCGLVNEQQDVESYDGTLGLEFEYVETHEPSTVQLQWLTSTEIGAKLPDHRQGNVVGERWCSGTLISNDLVLTAGHCFDVQDGGLTGWVSPFTFDSNGGRIFTKPHVLATLQQVNFRFQVNGQTGATRVPRVYPIEELVEYGRDRPGNLDYAIVRLGRGDTGHLPGEEFTPATALTRSANDDELLAILQHPQGKPKKVDAGKVLSADGANIFYDDIDTHGGSSGSGIRDAEGHVIGVHTNGGCRVNSGANRGEPTAAIATVSDVL